MPQIKNIYLINSFLKVNNLIQHFIPNSYKFVFLTPLAFDDFRLFSKTTMSNSFYILLIPIRYKNINNLCPCERNLISQKFLYFIEKDQIFCTNYLVVIVLIIEKEPSLMPIRKHQKYQSCNFDKLIYRP